MTRLTNDMRAMIADAATKTAFKVRDEDHAKAEDKLGMALYRSLFDDKTLKAVAKVPSNWFRQDACLRFNCGGYDLTFKVKRMSQFRPLIAVVG